MKKFTVIYGSGSTTIRLPVQARNRTQAELLGHVRLQSIGIVAPAWRVLARPAIANEFSR